jgi:hypothetical protein
MRESDGEYTVAGDSFVTPASGQDMEKLIDDDKSAELVG